MKLNQQQKENLKQLEQSGFITALLTELAADNQIAWQRATTKERREECWHLTRALKKLSNKFSILYSEAKKP